MLPSGGEVPPAAPGGGPVFLLDGDPIQARMLFYNNSSFDTISDNDAIAPNKSALLEGGTGTFSNYSSYIHGINGVMIDIDGMAGAPTLADFEFLVGNDNFPDQWPAAIDPTITFETGAGVNGSDRVKLIWPDGSIVKTWLRVRIFANANTGLSEDEVFYFGSVIGETNDNGANARVNVADVNNTRNNQSGFGTVGIENDFDHNRDGRVRVDDIAIARSNQSGFSPVELIAPRSFLAISAGLGRGVNFGNMLEAPNEGDWGFFVQEIFFDKVVEGGFDIIRLPISWTNHASMTDHTLSMRLFSNASTGVLIRRNNVV